MGTVKQPGQGRAVPARHGSAGMVRGIRVLCTGGTGFIGSRLLEALIEKGYDVLNYDLKDSAKFPTVIGDITDREAVLGAVSKCDYVFHLAAVANLDYARFDPTKAVKVNVEGTYCVAEACSTLDVPLSFASTCCVYGNSPEHPSHEESVCVPSEIYGATKLVGEYIVKKTCEKYNVLRFGTAYGPGMRPELAVYIFILQALTDIPLTIHGLGSQTRCFIYIDDLIDALLNVFEMKVLGETLNVTTDEELSVLQLASETLRMLGKPNSMISHVADRPGQVMREQIDISRAKKRLNWTPKTSFKDGLRKTITWIMQDARKTKHNCHGRGRSAS